MSTRRKTRATRQRAQRARPATAKRRSPLFFVLAAVIIAGAALYLLSPTPSQDDAPIVTERTFVVESDALYEYETTMYPSWVEVTASGEAEDPLTIGVVVDTDNLNFGSIPAGDNFGKRVVSLQNLRGQDAKVSLRARGGIEPFVEFGQNDFVLGPDQRATVDILFRASGAPVGNYTGQIDVVVKRSKAFIGKPW